MTLSAIATQREASRTSKKKKKDRLNLKTSAYVCVCSTCNSHSSSELNLTDTYSPLLGHRNHQPASSSESFRRYARHKSGHADSRSRKIRPEIRQGKSEQPERQSTRATSSSDPDKTPIAEQVERRAAKILPELLLDNDPKLSEREAKRKEIQSLIAKYAALEDEDILGRSTADAIASKYQRRKPNDHAIERSSCSLMVNGNEDEEVVVVAAPVVDEDDFVLVDKAKRPARKTATAFIVSRT